MRIYFSHLTLGPTNLYIYITETSETPTIFHINTIFIKKKNQKKKNFSETKKIKK